MLPASIKGQYEKIWLAKDIYDKEWLKQLKQIITFTDPNQE